MTLPAMSIMGSENSLEQSCLDFNNYNYSLNPVQAQHIFGHDLSLNCLQRYSADDTGRQLNMHNFL